MPLVPDKNGERKDQYFGWEIMIRFDGSLLGQRLSKLPSWGRVLFMASCCERMFPNYRSFSAESGFGDQGALEHALGAIWTWLEENQLPADLEELISACDEQAPDTLDFSSSYTSAALDAANAIAVTLEALADSTTDKAIEVASLARDTVDVFVQQSSNFEAEGSDLEQRILESLLMQTELTQQKKSLEVIEERASDRHAAIVDVRKGFSAPSLPRSA